MREGRLGTTLGDMTFTRLTRFTLAPLAVALTLSACSKGADPAALVAGDVALTGVASDDGLVPVAARAVRIGVEGRRKPACRTPVTVGGSIDVRWSNSAEGPVKTPASGELAVCEVDGDWSGIVFPAAGQDINDCSVSRTVNSPREYQGPCRWGWIESGKLNAPAG